MTVGKKEEAKCNLRAIQKHWEQIEKDRQEEMNDLMKQFRQQMRLDRKLCDKIEDKYLTFGLMNMVPDSLQCNFNKKEEKMCLKQQQMLSKQNKTTADCFNTQTKLEKSSPDVDDKNITIPNIVLLGPTGIGKSYFLNGLLGHTNPNAGYFPVGMSSRSCTREVSSITTKLFDGKFSNYGIDDMFVRVFDTPGFFDSDPCMIVHNKKTIARELDRSMHSFIYLFGAENKFDTNTQDIFGQLNEWTMGNIWDNFIIVFNYADFDPKKIARRYETMDYFFNFGPEELFWKIKNEQLNFVKETLTQRAKEQKWTRMIRVDGKQVSRLMKKEDFENIQISALNFEQARECTLIDGFVDSKASDCWKLPIMENDFDYKIVYMEKPQFYDNQYVFTHEMKKLHDLIKRNSHHPVATQKEYFKSEFAKDLKEYYSRAATIHTNIIGTMVDTEIDVSHCDKKFEELKNSLVEVPSCPEWTPWATWSDCKLCGHSIKFRNRNCTLNEQLIKKETCLEDFQDEETYQEQHCPFNPCEFTEWKDSSVCSKSCGLGFKQQSRKCKGLTDDCIGETLRTISCEIESCPTWTKWSDWSQCSKTCGSSLQSRIRDCSQDGSNSNLGNCLKLWPDARTNEERHCPFKSCSFTDWKDESECSASCGAGSKKQRRDCLGMLTDCIGEVERTIPCQIESCPIWTKWSDWNQCSKTCGSSLQTRTRGCSQEGWVTTVKKCLEIWPDAQTNEERYCPFISCLFTDWKDESECSKSCGTGSKQQSRECLGNPKDCIGDIHRTIPCQIASCPSWTKWSDWSQCSKTCGSSIQSRTRDCSRNGVRAASTNCLDLWPDAQTHEKRHCPFKSCEFTEWKDTSQCSVTCGNGHKEQTRECTSRPEDCLGQTSRLTSCELKPCPVWSSWSGWSRCSKSCGNGTKSRTRHCLKNTCSKTEKDINTCNLRGCLGAWGSWSSCIDVGKGPEKRKRHRKCSQGVCGEVILETKDCSSWGTGNYCGRDLANMILSASNACRVTGSGACTVLEEAREWKKEGDSSGEEFNEEVNGNCKAYHECCIERCHPRELGPEEC